jgi:predicted MFS family arabinose efflux permease
VLASVLALESADIGTVAAVATQLERGLHASLVEIGLLVTASSLVGALTTLPFGTVVDRLNRSRLLAAVVVAWAGAMILSGFTQSFLMLLLTRVGLGAVTAAAGPAVASLTGDYFPENERGKIYGYILTGQLLATGMGFLVAGNIAGLLGWRSAFFALATPSLVLAGVIVRFLVEPARKGGSQLEPPVRQRSCRPRRQPMPRDHERLNSCLAPTLWSSRRSVTTMLTRIRDSYFDRTPRRCRS